MTVIELGDRTPGSEHPPAAGPPEFGGRAFRWYALALIAVLCVLGVTGSARPEPRMFRTLWSVQFESQDRYAMTADTLFAVTMSTGGRLTAYDLSTGAARWAMPMPDPTGWPSAVPASGVVLLPAERVAQQYNSADGASYLAEYYKQTVAVDAHTGAELWRRPGELFSTTAGTVLLVERAGNGDDLHTFRLIRVRDGALVWTAAAGDASRLATAGADPLNPDRLITVTATGQVRVLRMADGVPVATGAIAFRETRPSDSDFTDLFADQRNLYVRAANGKGESLTAYRLDTLRRAWRVDGTARVTAYSCGPVVCSVQPDGVEAFDPVTGSRRWRASALQNAWPISRDWLLLVDDPGGDTYALVEASTGRRIAGLGPGTVAQNPEGTVAYLLQSIRPSALSLMRSRASKTRPLLSRTAVSRIDLVTGRVAVRGMMDQVTDFGCTATADRIACPTVRGRLVVAAVG
jgi:outer membrane protein assembly factor BamB